MTEPWWPKVVPRAHDGLDDELSLADYAHLLRRWWWLALATLLVTLGGAGLFTFLQPAVFSASATVLIRTESSAQLFPMGGNDVKGRSMAAEVAFLASTRYLTEAKVAAGNDDDVEIDTGPSDTRVESSVITFSASSPTPERAATTAEAWAEAYIDLRHQIDLADLDARITTVTATQQALTAERERVAQPIAQFDAEVKARRETSSSADTSAQRVSLLQTLNAQLQPIDTQLAAVNTDLAELRLKTDLESNPEVSARVNTEAEVETSPSSPKPLRNLALALVVGSILAVAAVVGVASFDDRIRNTDDVESTTGLGSLAVVPFARAKRNPIELASGSVVEESFQRIVSALDFAEAAGRSHQVLLVTSPQPGEGKSSTTARLAIALAAQSRNVLVIGGDLRRPTLSAMLGAPEGPGLGDYLSSAELDLDDCLHRVDGRRHLVIMPAGRIHDGRNPAEVLRSGELARVVSRLREFCDHILIDGPPLLPVVDALQLAAVSDAVVLSLYASRSRRRALQRALRLLDDAGPAPVLGYVLSGVPRTEDGYGGSY